jgi:putative SOS response-associated peptidase YedK
VCNRYSNKIGYRDYYDALRDLGVSLVLPEPSAAPNLQPNSDIRPTNRAPILRPVPGGLELCELRWGLIPRFHTKSIKEWNMLTTNARSETLFTNAVFKHAARSQRCLVPTDQFYEWTGPKGKKTKWAFRVKNADWFCFAGIWDRATTSDGEIDSFALVTMPAGPDMQPYHDRQPVILGELQYQAWLDPNASVAPLLVPYPPGVLEVVRAEGNT